ncbi:MAG: type II toxin-antitoxin system RelE/ParE family toxin [Ignavibacteriaceae bacterium]
MIYLFILKLKTKWFNKWAEKNLISDEKLLDTLKNISNNLGTADLGVGLYKVRTPKIGQGKRGGFRTIVVFKEEDIAIFVYGFSKTDKDNLNKEELKYFKKLSKDLLSINRQEYKRLEKLGDFIKYKGIIMRASVKKAIGNTVQDLVKRGVKTSFTEKELKALGVEIPEVEINAIDIQEIREKTNLSQNVFAKILNVSSSSVKQWEQGKRTPTGSTKVLLELLRKNPDILNYRIESTVHGRQA